MPNFDYHIRKSKKAKRLRITVYPDQRVLVTVPYRIPNRFAHSFVLEKEHWIEKKLKEVKGKESQLKGSRDEYLKFKEKARKLVHERLEYFNEFYGYKYNKVFIKNQKTLWGSCSKKGNLNFNYKIALLPQELADYIIVHELCHLGELNHSKKFWDLVEKKVPNHKKLRKRLRSWGMSEG